MADFYCDGHFISATIPEMAVAEFEHLYGYTPDVVRPWRKEDEEHDGNNHPEVF